MKKRAFTYGFTLIEIMVVVAIIATIAAIAISSMMRSRMNANETVAIASCKIISSACQSYFSTEEEFPTGLEDLASPHSNPPYIDAQLAAGEKAGYEFDYELINVVAFTLNAAPTFPGRTGQRYFYIDETGTVRYNQEGDAGADDPAIQ